MPGATSDLGQIQPTRLFALRLQDVRDAGNPLPRKELAAALEMAPAAVDDLFEGAQLPNDVVLTVLLHTIYPAITVAEIAAWLTALDFARSLSFPTVSAVSPVRGFNRILRLLEKEIPSPPPPFHHRHRLQVGEDMPSRDELEALLRAAYRADWRRAPWHMAYDFAHDLLQAQQDDSDGSPKTEMTQSFHIIGLAEGASLLVGSSQTDKTSVTPLIVRAMAYEQRLNSAQLRRDIAGHSLPMAMPVTIYLSDEANHEAVESAIYEWLEAQGLEVIYSGEAVIGSFWRPLLARIKREGEEHLEDGASIVGRAAGLYGLDTRQADVNQKEAEAFAKVMEALEGIESAVIHHGTLLVVKHAGTVVRRELSQLEVEALRRRPVLTARPDTILSELQRLTEENEVKPSFPHAALDG
ncbi:hypothetical protein [Nonomuraea sp. C10]|uniref:hypothetical protein n=1 Tax=Nonomuraea sp. C10 TaxID=2600577 RepID=UPI0011CED128|nr:hypothetical protein [Nonomuraea sp. C10]TXK34903.1 hypothetical protein FR742_37025 [Nonomuraea sp. C10]